MDSNQTATRLTLAVAAPLLLFLGALPVPAAADANVTTEVDARAQLDLVAAHQLLATESGWPLTPLFLPYVSARGTGPHAA